MFLCLSSTSAGVFVCLLHQQVSLSVFYISRCLCLSSTSAGLFVCFLHQHVSLCLSSRSDLRQTQHVNFSRLSSTLCFKRTKDASLDGRSSTACISLKQQVSCLSCKSFPHRQNMFLLSGLSLSLVSHGQIYVSLVSHVRKILSHTHIAPHLLCLLHV